MKRREKHLRCEFINILLRVNCYDWKRVARKGEREKDFDGYLDREKGRNRDITSKNRDRQREKTWNTDKKWRWKRKQEDKDRQIYIIYVYIYKYKYINKF